MCVCGWVGGWVCVSVFVCVSGWVGGCVCVSVFVCVSASYLKKKKKKKSYFLRRQTRKVSWTASNKQQHKRQNSSKNVNGTLWARPKSLPTGIALPRLEWNCPIYFGMTFWRRKTKRERKPVGKCGRDARFSLHEQRLHACE